MSANQARAVDFNSGHLALFFIVKNYVINNQFLVLNYLYVSLLCQLVMELYRFVVFCPHSLRIH